MDHGSIAVRLQHNLDAVLPAVEVLLVQDDPYANAEMCRKKPGGVDESGMSVHVCRVSRELAESVPLKCLVTTLLLFAGS